MGFGPGTTIGSNLRLVRLLATGGMGSVWVAEHLGLRTLVAVKFMDDVTSRDESLVRRFSQEAAAAAEIKSPHVVQVFDHGVVEGNVPYIVMELMEGESLRQHLDRLGRLDVRETAAILGQLCRALSKAHSLGIVHRDIKPDNIFLTDSDGELFVKVLDFGIAKKSVSDSLAVTSTGAAIGTPHYMSPEQFVSAKDVTLAADLWAVGVVAYRCLTGELPFGGETFGALCIAVNAGRFAPACSVRPDLPPAIDAWFRSALATAPSERFGSAKGLVEGFLAAAGLPPGQVVSVDSSLPSLASRRRDSTAVIDAPGSGARTLTVGPAFESEPRSPQRIASRTGPSIQGAAVNKSESGLPRRRTGVIAAAFVASAVVALLVAVKFAASGDTAPASASALVTTALPTPPIETRGPSPSVDPERTELRGAGGQQDASTNAPPEEHPNDSTPVRPKLETRPKSTSLPAKNGAGKTIQLSPRSDPSRDPMEP